ATTKTKLPLFQSFKNNGSEFCFTTKLQNEVELNYTKIKQYENICKREREEKREMERVRERERKKENERNRE
ncbi:hypothetical protein WUBG_10604, partial [Wuchereria bancrofti]